MIPKTSGFYTKKIGLLLLLNRYYTRQFDGFVILQRKGIISFHFSTIVCVSGWYFPSLGEMFEVDRLI